MKFKDPIPSKDYPGFFEIPGYSKYVINEQGDLIRKFSGKYAKWYKNLQGYLEYYVTTDITGYRQRLLQHRALMLAFKYPLDFKPEDMTVDHLDGNKTNNHLENLEWVTNAENVRRAYMLGLHPPIEQMGGVETLDPISGILTYYPTRLACMEALNLTPNVLNYRLLLGDDRVYPDGLQYRIAKPGEPWTPNPEPRASMLVYGVDKPALLKSAFTGKIRRFDKLQDVAKFVGISVSCLSQRMDRDNQAVLPGGFLVKLEADLSPWREIDYFEEYRKQLPRYKPVEVFNIDNNTLYRFETVNGACSYFQTKGTAGSYRLKSGGDSIFFDKKSSVHSRWAYYPILTQYLNDHHIEYKVHNLPGSLHDRL